MNELFPVPTEELTHLTVPLLGRSVKVDNAFGIDSINSAKLSRTTNNSGNTGFEATFKAL